MANDKLKPLHKCLDIVLNRLVEDWNNYGDDRKELDSDEILTQFGLEPPYLKHEFLVGIINHLIKDGYAALIESRKFDSEISNYQKNTIITITGYYLIKKEGGYTRKARRKWIMDLPKVYWWVIAIITFFVGFFLDILKERWTKETLPPSSKSQQEFPTSVDSLQSHKNRHLNIYLKDSLYVLTDTILPSN